MLNIERGIVRISDWQLRCKGDNCSDAPNIDSRSGSGPWGSYVPDGSVAVFARLSESVRFVPFTDIGLALIGSMVWSKVLFAGAEDAIK
jgi:hypothetical protein